jgi:hypothetical protein
VQRFFNHAYYTQSSHQRFPVKWIGFYNSPVSGGIWGMNHFFAAGIFPNLVGLVENQTGNV